jgi:phospholipase D1/2
LHSGRQSYRISSVSILNVDRNVWRIAIACRFAVFRDVATCFAAMRSSLLKARSSIVIVGWDIDSRCRLVGPSGTPDDGFPAELGPFLKALAERRPNLKIHLLLWDFSPIYALEREAFPRAKLDWPPAVSLWLDDCLPTGSSQHQKLVIVDESVAFSGGLVLTIRRWDTAQHLVDDPHRVDPGDTPYDPFHDVQAVVDGDAAAALADIARQRWHDASGTHLPPFEKGDAWPDNVRAEFENVGVGIARTIPKDETREEVREVERLFCDMIASAERHLYIENQFLASGTIAEAIARRLKAKPALDVLIVTPNSLHSWLELMALTYGRTRFRKILEASGETERIRIVYPRVQDGRASKAVMIHSKVMIVDDRIARIGSANLNNRSMGADSECDLVVEAASDEDRAKIAALRNSLIAMHCGVSEQQAAQTIAATSLVAASRTLAANGRSLEDVQDPEPDAAGYARYLDRVADPERPIEEGPFLALVAGKDAAYSMRAVGGLAIVALLLLAVAAAWSTNTQHVSSVVNATFERIAQDPAALVIIPILYVAAGFMLVPITLLIVATSAAFGITWGLAYAAIGTLASAVASYLAGMWLGRASVRRMMGGKLRRIRNAVSRRGVMAIAAVRMVPIAPFTVVNLAAGALGIGFTPYLAGTIVGMAPGFLVLSALGHNLYRLVSEPTLATLAAAIGVLLLWGATALALQYWVKKDEPGSAW